MSAVIDMKFRTNKLLEEYETTPYHVAKNGGGSYRTFLRWVGDNSPEYKNVLVFLRGLGLTDDEIRQLPLGEVFEIVD